MVDEKTVQEVPEQEQQPADPQRRKLLKIIGGGIGVVAVGGGAYLLGRGSGENEASTSTMPGEATATTQPSPGTTAPAPATTVPESTPTTSPEISTTIPGETLAIPLESLPTSIDDPQVWALKMASLMELVYNDLRIDLLEYIYKGGVEGNAAQSLGDDITITALTRESFPEEYYSIESRLVPERTRLVSSIISVEENRTFMDFQTRRIVDYSILPEEIHVNTGAGVEAVTLYLINSIDTICVYDENGVCR